MSCVLTSHLRCSQDIGAAQLRDCDITDTVMSHNQEYRIFVYLSIPSADYRDENTRDNTFDKVIKTIDTKTKSVGMIIVMPTRIVANVNLIPCPRTAPARDSQS